MRWSVIFASIYITEKEGDFGQFKGKFFIFVGCDSFSALNLADMTTASGKEKAARRCGPPGICKRGFPLDFWAKKYPLQKRDQSYHTTAAVTMQEKILPEGKFCHIL